jgi:heme oxygenase (biliverdin-IX-beta and delta-forming)
VQAESIHERLRHATNDLHHGLERELAAVFEQLSFASYRELLRALYGFYVPIEPALEQIARCHPELEIPIRGRAELLIRDLRALELEPSETSISRATWIGDADSAAGTLYVLEGSCLGGQVIARQVERRLDLGSEGGLAFFTGDGSATARRWREVIAWLEAFAARRDELQRDGIVEGARRTFDEMARWLADRGVTR